MNVLKKIIEDKKNEIPKQLSKTNLSKTNKDVYALLKKNNQRRHKLNLIAELKRVSPSLGILNRGMTVKSAIEMYEPYASALSILTEKNYFGGSLNDLEEASRLTNLPLLRKDFITETIQVAEARLFGADFYLLIVAALDKNQLRELIEAGKEFNMPALIEVHNQAELETALEFNVQILGINNRNLIDLSIDLQTTNQLSKIIPGERRENLVLVSESGLKTSQDLQEVDGVVDAVLMGTAFMENADPQKLLKTLFG
ncbi:MAG: indole-3-glycerol phosphate synthase TrpC [Spirochaetia bacterium]|nr:indole-3-glycerol phosphate synthase TrpC [Spirochaetia bacterium]